MVILKLKNEAKTCVDAGAPALIRFTIAIGEEVLDLPIN
jgi:hypothetical protein